MICWVLSDSCLLPCRMSYLGVEGCIDKKRLNLLHVQLDHFGLPTCLELVVDWNKLSNPVLE